jgi:hypothetical protein
MKRYPVSQKWIREQIKQRKSCYHEGIILTHTKTGWRVDIMEDDSSPRDTLRFMPDNSVLYRNSPYNLKTAIKLFQEEINTQIFNREWASGKPHL